ncbi:MAG: imidazole glycerol phosphate synthase cyclase subunit [Planctomycetota bacterium]|nr:imidazole glycerol phosphate synthase cyclase subunit [Planctomycetota bacterium]
MPLRVIPRLDIKAPNLVKGIRLEGLRVLGKPSDFAQSYFEQGADELIYQDIVASLYGRNNIVELVRETAERIFVPLTVGGGVRTIMDIQNLLRAGADKVCINTAATTRPAFIKEAAKIFGTQCIVVAVEAIRKPDGRWEAFTNNGREHTGLDARDWSMRAVDLGCGELLITSVDREGTKKGYDLDLIAAIAPNVPIPVLVHGGAGSLQDLVEAAKLGIDGLVVSSLLHYRVHTVAELKAHLVQAGVEVRQ